MCRVYPNHDNPLYVRVCQKAGRGWTCFILWEHLEGQWDSTAKRHVEGWMVDAYGQSEKPDPRPRKKVARTIPNDLMKGEGSDEIALINGQPLTREQVEKFSKYLGWSPDQLNQLPDPVLFLSTIEESPRFKEFSAEASPDSPFHIDILDEMEGVDLIHPFWDKLKEMRSEIEAGRGKMTVTLETKDGPIKDMAGFRKAFGLPEDMEIELAPPTEEPKRFHGVGFTLEINGTPVAPDPWDEYHPLNWEKRSRGEWDLLRKQFPHLQEWGWWQQELVDDTLSATEFHASATPIEDSPPVQLTVVDEMTVLPPFNPEPLDWTPFNEFVPETVRKRMYAYDLAAMLEFEWDYEDEEREDELFECLEQEGYEWTGEAWKPI